MSTQNGITIVHHRNRLLPSSPIATIATILAMDNISIKNIGIIHNREYENGVLRLELYDNDGLEKSIRLLKKHHYVIYER